MIILPRFDLDRIKSLPDGESALVLSMSDLQRDEISDQFQSGRSLDGTVVVSRRQEPLL